MPEGGNDFMGHLKVALAQDTLIRSVPHMDGSHLNTYRPERGNARSKPSP